MSIRIEVLKNIGASSKEFGENEKTKNWQISLNKRG